MKYFFLLIISIVQLPAQNIPAIWQNISTDKLEGTRTTCMGEGKDGAVFIGSINGVYRSVDKGQNWQRVNKGLPPQKPILAMCNTKDGVLFVAADSNVYRSYDNGDTWTKIMTATGERNVGFLYAHKSGDVYAGTWGGLYRSADSGASWQSYGSSIPHGVDESPGSYGCIAFGKYNRIFASSGYGIYISTNNGASWTMWKSSFYYYVVTGDTTDLVIINHDNVFVADQNSLLQNDRLSGLVYPNAPTFDLITASQNIQGYIGNIGTVTRTFPRSYLIIDNKNIISAPRNYGIDSLALRPSIEYGHFKNTGLSHRIVTELFKHSDGSIYAGTLGGGVYRSTNMGDTWKGSSKGLGDPYITYMFNDSKTNRVFVATGSGLFYTSDAGQSWNSFSEGLENYNVFKMAQSSKGNYYALTWMGVYKYSISSTKWQRLYIAGNQDYIFFNDLAVGKNDTLIVGTEGEGAFFSIDEGKTWKKSSIDVTIARGIYYSSLKSQWYIGSIGTYSVSRDGGVTWEMNSLGGGVGSGTIHFTEDADGNLYCLSILGFINIDENTQPPTYKVITGNSPSSIYYVVTNVLSQIYTVNNKGIYRMWQPFGNWSPYGDSLPAVATTGLTVDNEGYAYVGTMGRGVFRTKLVSDSLFAPALLSPKNKAENVLYTNVPCMWDTSISARGYHLQLSTTEDMSQLVLNDSSLKGLQRSVNNLRSNTHYYWRVRAKHKQYLSEWSPVWTFKTLAQLPKKLQLLSPPDKSTAQPVKTTLTWTGDDNAESYEVQVMDAVSQTVVYADSTLTATTANLSLEVRKSYQWKVRARGSVGIGEWSDSWQFSTEESVDVTEQAAEQQIRILPQPASETLHIMGIEKGVEERDVQVVIADMQGRILLSTEATHINISGLTDGVYTCRINVRGKVHCLCFSVLR